MQISRIHLTIIQYSKFYESFAYKIRSFYLRSSLRRKLFRINAAKLSSFEKRAENADYGLSKAGNVLNITPLPHKWRVVPNRIISTDVKYYIQRLPLKLHHFFNLYF